MDFLKSKIFLLWAGLNAVFPTIVVIIFNAIDLALTTQGNLAFLTVGIILAANIYAIAKHKKYRKLFGITAFLNILSLFLAGDVSFFTAIPDLPFLFESLYQMLVQYVF